MGAVKSLAFSIGLGTRRRGGPCPACGATRTAKDARPPVLVGESWRCMACREGGDAVAMASWFLHGHGAPHSRIEWLAVERLIAQATGVEVNGTVSRGTDADTHRDLARFLAGARRLADCNDGLLREYLQGRGIPYDAPAGYVGGSKVPSFWRAGYPIVVPAFTGRGALASVAGRAITERYPSKIWARGIESAGLVFLDPKWARPWVRGGVGPDRLWIVEGITDYLTVASTRPCIGVTSGSFDALRLLKDKLNDTTIFTAMDPDSDGRRYEEKIAEAIYPHVARKVHWTSMK